MKKLRTDSNSATEKAFTNRWPWFALIAVILLTSAIRIRLLSIPFERDEGEYAYAGQLILQGVPPYEKAYNMKMPGIYAAYALLLTLFGHTHTGIHFGLVLINAATAVLIFLLARQLFNPLVGAVAGSSFALFSISQRLLGIAANAEHFVILPVVAAILLLLKAVRIRQYFTLFLSGLLLGLAFMMKQHGAAFIVFAAVYLLVTQLRNRPIHLRFLFGGGALFTVGVFLPFAVTCLILWRCGVFSKFWFWTFTYGRQYVSLVSLSDGLQMCKDSLNAIIPPSICLWVLAGIGLIGLFRDSKLRHQSLFMTVFLFFSFLSVCPGLYFRQHYWILFLPAAAISAGVGAAFIYNIFSRYSSFFIAKVVLTMLALFILFCTLYQQRYFFFTFPVTYASRATYGPNPFPESLKIAEFIKQNSEKSDTVAVIGSEPQIFFYSQRRSATSYIYTYPIVELHPYALQMQEEMISQIEQASPKFLVIVHVDMSWLAVGKSEKKIFDWTEQYASKFYHPVCIADIVAADQTIYRWGIDAATYSPKSKYWVTILRHNRFGNASNVIPLKNNMTDTAN